MPPKRAPLHHEPQNLAKNKKIKFSATMPQFEDKSHESSDQSQSNEENFDKESSSSQQDSNDMEVSEQSSESEQPQQTNKIIEQAKFQEESSEQQEDNSDSEQVSSSSSSQQVHKQQKINSQAPYNIPPQPNQSDENIPQQQVETDDIDSKEDRESDVVYNDGNGMKIQKIQEEKKVESIQVQQKVNNRAKNSEESESEIFVPLKKDVIMPEQSKKIELEENQLPEEKNHSNEQKQKKDKEQLQQKKKKQKKDKKEEKDKKSKKKQKKSKDLPEVQPQAIIQQPVQQKHQKTSQQNETDQQSQKSPEQNHTFYQYLHPYLMLVGTAVIESYMSSKTVYKANEATGWGSRLSQKILLKAYMDDVEGLEEFDEESENEEKRKEEETIIQAKLQQNKFYNRVQAQLNELAVSEKKMHKISLAKIFYLIKKFKLIVSCIIMEKKPKCPTSVNISTSAHWNKQNDGQINFSYDGNPFFAMLTLYGVIIEKKKSSREE